MREFEADYCDELVEKQAAELAAKDAELAALRAERDEAVKFIKYLRYLEEAEDTNAVMWHIRKYEVKP